MKTKEDALIPQKQDEASRREFLIKAGKMALYVPPAMMVLMHPSRNAFACKSLSLSRQCNTNGGIQTSSLLYSGENHHRRHNRRRRH